jgi:hypothetical protein
MIVLWSCRRARRWRPPAIIERRCQSTAVDSSAGANSKGATPHGHEGRPERRFGKKRFGKTVWSALQTHLQGVTRAMLAIMPEKRRHRTALLS